MTERKTPLERYHERIDPRIKIASNCLYLLTGIAIVYFVGGMVGIAIGAAVAAASIYGTIKAVINA
jgi:hypothetical protein